MRESLKKGRPLCAGREHSPRVYHGYYSQRPDFSAKEQAAILKAVEGGEPLESQRWRLGRRSAKSRMLNSASMTTL